MKTIPLVIALAAAATLGACDRGSSDRTVGQKLDHAVQRTEQSLAEAGEKTRETLHENVPAVEQELSAAGRKVEAAGAKTVDTTREVVKDAGHGGADGKAGSPASDLMITASIKADLVKDPDLSALKIDVDTHDGVVTLNGLANDEAGKQRAERMAQAVKGVREVRNYLTLKRG